MFKKAVKSQSKLRLGLFGVAGSGKTFSALRIAKGLGGRVAVIDTERGSASKYAGDVADFDVLELESFAPLKYVEAIKAADAAGYDVLVIDSASHAWAGKDGALEQVDRIAAKSASKNSFVAWKDVTPQQHEFIDTILQSRCHVIVTLRAKTAYDQGEAGQKRAPRRVGLAPIQRDGFEYELDVLGLVDDEHRMHVTKTRCPALDGAVIDRPGEDLARTLLTWLDDGAERQLSPRELHARDVDACVAAIDAAQDDEALEAAKKGASRLRPTLDEAEYARVQRALKGAVRRVQDALQPEPVGEPVTEPSEWVDA